MATRKTVTVVFADVVGSTALGDSVDPEVLQQRLAQYFEQARTVLERHGGTVEKFIGDAVMAVFGIPQAREDDALRAVRAAAELRDVVATHGELDLRIGVNTGEVLAGDPASGSSFVSGDAVNVAARLEQLAPAGEVLIGKATQELVRDAVRADPVGPLALKGKAESVRAWRLVEVLADAAAFTRRIDAPFVGRERELEALQAAFDEATRERACRLVTVLGEPGIGKSRLVRELLAVVAERAHVLVGRCASYGEAATYRPLAEIVEQLAGQQPRDALASLIGGDEGRLAGERIAAAVGRGGVAGPPEETQWAVRKLFEGLARERPLVVVLDDVHWADPALLELVEYVVGFASEAPMLVVAVARTDLLELSPSWSAPRPNATQIVLEPLSDDDSDALIDRLLGADDVSARLRDRIRAAAEGNPLFVEQMLAMLAESPADGDTAVPPTIQALLTARIDALGDAERAVVERAAVEGRFFHRGAVAALAADDVRPAVGTSLLGLVRKQLVRPDRSAFPGDDGYRFAHVLVRDVAYDSVPKRVRAELHERYAGWLDGKPGGRAGEHDEIAGYHLEQAAGYLRELGVDEERVSALARRAAERLAAAAERAAARGNNFAEASLFTRAAALLGREDALRADILARLAHSYLVTADFARMDETLSAIEDVAARANSVRVNLYVEHLRLLARLVTAGDVRVEEIERIGMRSLEFFSQTGDELGLARTYLILSWASSYRARLLEREELLEQAAGHAERAGARDEQLMALEAILAVLASGPRPVEDALERCDAVLERARGSSRLDVSTLWTRARLVAMQGRFEEARELLERASAIAKELGMARGRATAAVVRASIELLAGHGAEAERIAVPAYERLRESHQQMRAAWAAGILADAAYEQGHEADAERYAVELRNAAAPDDVDLQAKWRQVQAKVLARRGDVAKAEALAREAVALLTETDALRHQADARMDLAAVLEAAGRRAEATELVEEARGLYERKGDVVSAQRADERLTESGS